MKWMIASDIHGSEFYCRKLFTAFENEKADRMVLLGDYLYHGPRNDLPRDYNTKAVAEILNSYKEKLICVRGNCDAEVDQMVLDFPMMAEYCVLDFDGIQIFASHGHKYNAENPPYLRKGDVLLCGHTHIPKCVKKEKFIYMNPGSVSLPKENSHQSYMIYDNGCFHWKDMEGNEFFYSKTNR